MEQTHQRCPYTDCGSSDAFAYNDDKRVGQCHSCGRAYPSSSPMYDWAKATYPTNDKRKEPTRMDTSKIKAGVFDGIRGIDEDVCRLYGIVRYIDDAGETLGYGFNYGENVKMRDASPPGKGKKIWWKNPGPAPLKWFGPTVNAGSSKMLYITEGECLLPTAQVMTPEGWVMLKDLDEDSMVLQVNEDLSTTFVHPLGIVDKEYEGDLIEYQSGSYYSITTEGHDLVRLNGGSVNKYKATRRIDLPVPRTVTCNDPDHDDFDLYQLWIMLSADFTFRSEGDIYGAFKKDRKIKRVREILNRNEIRYTESKDGGGFTSFFIHRGHGFDQIEKDLPWSILRSSRLKDLLAEVILWDGNSVPNRNQDEFSTNRMHNAEVVQAMAHLCGYTSTIIHRSNQWGEWLKVSILYSKQTSSTQKGYTRIPHSGRVMCVTVPSGMILVRQSGSISVTGNCDAASLFQVLGKARPVVSASTGGIGKKFLEQHHDYLSKFEQIIWAGELDDAGRANADRLYEAFPTKLYYVPMSKHKDANDFLIAGDGDDLKWAALKPQRYTPENFFTGDDAVSTAITTENPYEYVPTGHSGLDASCRGLVKGGITFIKAPRGTGKTEVARFFEMAMLNADDHTRIALVHMEEGKSTTYRSMASYHLGTNVRTKDDAKANGVSEEEVIKAAQEATKGERTVIFEMRSHDDPLDILDHVRLAAAVYGCSYIFIDHVQRLAYLSSAGVDGATSVLTALAAQAAQLAKELNIGIIFLSQVNDDGRTKYASSLEEEAIICIGLDRDTESEDELVRNTTRFLIQKNRPFSKLGDAGSIYFDPETFMLREEF